MLEHSHKYEENMIVDAWAKDLLKLLSELSLKRPVSLLNNDLTMRLSPTTMRGNRHFDYRITQLFKNCIF